MTGQKPTKTIRLYPVEGVSVYPWPSVEFDATPEEAEFLLAHVPPPFTVEPPDAFTAVYEGARAAVGDSIPDTP